jgi:uncharacterized protein YbcI
MVRRRQSAEPTGLLREISRAMVKLYREQFGRGHGTEAGCPALERRMVQLGEEQRAREIRMLFQHTTEPKFRADVERITGRRVIGFMSGMDVNNDLSSEVFTLEPEPVTSAE